MYKVKESTLVKVHEEYVFQNYGMQICVWENGRVSLMTQGTTFASEPNGLVCIIDAQGLGNTDHDFYSEGWVVWDNDKQRYIEPETGRELTDRKMFQECIENPCQRVGDFS